MNPFDNRLILLGIALEIVLLILFNYTSLGNSFLETAPVPAAFWALIGPIMLLMLMLEEIRKWLVRRRLCFDRRSLAASAQVEHADKAWPRPLD